MSEYQGVVLDEVSEISSEQWARWCEWLDSERGREFTARFHDRIAADVLSGAKERLDK